MRKLLCGLFAFFCFSLMADSPSPDAPYRIVFIHLGSRLPSFMSETITQARLFNPEAEIILVANQEALGEFHLDNLTVIPAEEIAKSQEHLEFIHVSRLDRGYREGFWFYATERLFYLDDLISQYDLKQTFHLENDNMLYADLSLLLPVFLAHYQGIAAPFESEDRGFASFIFIRDNKSTRALARHLLEHAGGGQNEMILINSFQQKFGSEFLDYLPVIMEEYTHHYPLSNALGGVAQHPENFFKYADEFHSLFDGCSYGQFLGGIDPRNGPDGPGYVNPQCFFRCTDMKIEWHRDELDRRIPCAVFADKAYRINNLHIHAKNLEAFRSL